MPQCGQACKAREGTFSSKDMEELAKFFPEAALLMVFSKTTQAFICLEFVSGKTRTPKAKSFSAESVPIIQPPSRWKKTRRHLTFLQDRSFVRTLSSFLSLLPINPDGGVQGLMGPIRLFRAAASGSCKTGPAGGVAFGYGLGTVGFCGTFSGQQC